MYVIYHYLHMYIYIYVFSMSISLVYITIQWSRIAMKKIEFGNRPLPSLITFDYKRVYISYHIEHNIQVCNVGNLTPYILTLPFGDPVDPVDPAPMATGDGGFIPGLPGELGTGSWWWVEALWSRRVPWGWRFWIAPRARWSWTDCLRGSSSRKKKNIWKWMDIV